MHASGPKNPFRQLEIHRGAPPVFRGDSLLAVVKRALACTAINQIRRVLMEEASEERYSDGRPLSMERNTEVKGPAHDDSNREEALHKKSRTI